jgi:hypothetical protein
MATDAQSDRALRQLRPPGRRKDGVEVARRLAADAVGLALSAVRVGESGAMLRQQVIAGEGLLQRRPCAGEGQVGLSPGAVRLLQGLALDVAGEAGGVLGELLLLAHRG